MPIAKRLKEYLDRHEVKYTTTDHSSAYTAQEIAHLLHISGKEVAKTVIVKISGDRYVMAVLPAHHRIDVGALARSIGAKDLRLANESEFKDLFPGCELGAMPPFGNLYDMVTYVAEPLTRDDEITFNCGSHTMAMRMKYDDFARLVRPITGRWSHLATRPPFREPM